MKTDYANGLIQTWDNFLSHEELHHLHKVITELKYSFGETDDFDTPPTGVVSEFDTTNKIYKILYDKIIAVKDLSNFYCNRSYVNLFAPKENAYYHQDFIPPVNGYTALYYPNITWDINDGGETRFFFTNNPFDSIIQETDVKEHPIILSIAPIPNRLVVFDGNLLHAATSFNNTHRFSIAFKFKSIENES